jgi:hypothetical protein
MLSIAGRVEAGGLAFNKSRNYRHINLDVRTAFPLCTKNTKIKQARTRYQNQLSEVPASIQVYQLQTPPRLQYIFRRKYRDKPRLRGELS